MLPKPPECTGCPWYGDGQGFVPDSTAVGTRNRAGQSQQSAVFVGQNPGADEELVGQPFVGKTGQILRSFVQQYLAAAPVGYANLVKCRRQSYNVKTNTVTRSNAMPKPRTKEWQEIVSTCTSRHLRLPESALIVACGEHAAAWLVPQLKGPELHIRGSFIETHQTQR